MAVFVNKKLLLLEMSVLNGKQPQKMNYLPYRNRTNAYNT